VTFAGATLMEIAELPDGRIVVGCPGCAAQRVFPPDEEPLLEHMSPDCPVFLQVVDAQRRFIETGEVRG
jgi:hypothetical protein